MDYTKLFEICGYDDTLLKEQSPRIDKAFQRAGIAENPSVDQRRMDLRAAGRKDTRVVCAGCHRYHGRGHSQQCPSRVRLAHKHRRTSDGFFISSTSLSGVVPRANKGSSPSGMSFF